MIRFNFILHPNYYYVAWVADADRTFFVTTKRDVVYVTQKQGRREAI